MKRIIYITLILLSVLSCKKPDSKIEKLIVGTWKVEPKHDIGLTGGALKYPTRLPRSVTFTDVQTYYFTAGNTCIDSLGPYNFRVNKGIIFFDTLPYCGNSVLIREDPIRIIKISKNKMKLSELDDESSHKWTFIK